MLRDFKPLASLTLHSQLLLLVLTFFPLSLFRLLNIELYCVIYPYENFRLPPFPLLPPVALPPAISPGSYSLFSRTIYPSELESC